VPHIHDVAHLTALPASARGTCWRSRTIEIGRKTWRGASGRCLSYGAGASPGLSSQPLPGRGQHRPGTPPGRRRISGRECRGRRRG
jgi:hypothetical protein